MNESMPDNVRDMQPFWFFGNAKQTLGSFRTPKSPQIGRLDASNPPSIKQLQSVSRLSGRPLCFPLVRSGRPTETYPGTPLFQIVTPTISAFMGL